MPPRPSESLLAHFSTTHRLLTQLCVHAPEPQRRLLTGCAHASFFIHNVRGRQWDFLGWGVLSAAEGMVVQAQAAVVGMGEAVGEELVGFALVCAAAGLLSETHVRISKGIYSWERIQRLASLGALEHLISDLASLVKTFAATGRERHLYAATLLFIQQLQDAAARLVEHEGEAERSGEEAAARRRVPAGLARLAWFEGEDEAWRVAAGLVVVEMERRTDGILGLLGEREGEGGG
ncbi:hypothetical protein CDD81_5771 [Ophiocordyceps australis]|uniref:Uncharacterized protein n=1 Tax=Ophiocordyceps australis TaxID=1399860 RepID=A0A2C5Y7S4_9HYPO|nr:hypothetical protein CDD81_5771 [Ophiocordyceps australis]